MPYQRGSGFVGLQQYLNANPEAAANMGNQLASQVEQQGQAAQSAIDAQAAQARQQAAAGTPSGNLYGLDTAEIEALRGMPPTYTGPESMGNVDALNKQAGEAQQTARLAGTDAGRAVLLQRGQGAGQPYGVGARSLDAFLAGRGAGARLSQAASRFGELQKYLGTAQQGVADAVTGAKAQTEQVRGQIAALPAPQYAPSAPPRPPPSDPRAQGVPDVEEENRKLIRMRGGRG